MLTVCSHLQKQFICRRVAKCHSNTKKFLTTQYKMVLVVRKDLGMSRGKLAAQCAHAAVQAFKKTKSFQRMCWELNGQPKVVVRCSSEIELYDLHKKAASLNLTAAIIKDAGKTQLQPGTPTVLGVGPGPADKIDLITGHLKLL